MNKIFLSVKKWKSVQCFNFFVVGENDKVGVLRSTNGALHFFVNGIDQGPAAANIPSRIYAVIDMYGKCAQVTITDDNNRDIGLFILWFGKQVRVSSFCTHLDTSLICVGAYQYQS